MFKHHYVIIDGFVAGIYICHTVISHDDMSVFDRFILGGQTEIFQKNNGYIVFCPNIPTFVLKFARFPQGFARIEGGPLTPADFCLAWLHNLQIM